MPEYVTGRVFVSYSHDSQEHRQWVLGLANRLRDEGVDCWSVEQQGVIGTYSGLRGKQDGFFERVPEPLRKLVHRLTPRSGSSPSPQDLPDSTQYLQDQLEKNGWIDMHGLQIGDQRTREGTAS